MDFFKEIKKGISGNLYLLYGPEEYTKEEALNQLIESIIPEAYMDLNYQAIDGTESTAEDIILAAETLPFLSDKRVVVIKNYSGLSGKKTGDEEELKKYLQRLPDTTCLIFYQRDDVDKKRVIYKTIQKHGEIIEFERLSPRDLIRWTRKRFQIYNKNLSDSDLEYFLMLAGNDLVDIKNEVEKLAAFAGERTVITREDIDKMVTPSPEFTVFQFIDAVAAKQKGKALYQMEILLEQGQSIFGIIALLARQIRIMILCKGYSDIGYTLNQIKDKLKEKPHSLHPYSVQRGMQQSQNFSKEQLHYFLDQCLKLDFEIKSGKINDRLGLELLVFKMCKKSQAM